MKYSARDFCPEIAQLALTDIGDQIDQCLAIAVAGRHLLERQPEDRRDEAAVCLFKAVERICTEGGSRHYLRDYLAHRAQREADG
jgi:hypothetical protein